MIQISSCDRDMISQRVFRWNTKYELVVNEHMTVELVNIVHFHVWREPDPVYSPEPDHRRVQNHTPPVRRGHPDIWNDRHQWVPERKTAEHRWNADMDWILLNPAAVQFKLHVFAILQNVVCFLIKKCAIFCHKSGKQRDAKFGFQFPNCQGNGRLRHKKLICGSSFCFWYLRLSALY